MADVSLKLSPRQIKRQLSDAPVRLSRTAWFYEHPKSLQLVVECREPYHRTLVVNVPLTKLLPSLRRMGVLPPQTKQGHPHG